MLQRLLCRTLNVTLTAARPQRIRAARIPSRSISIGQWASRRAGQQWKAYKRNVNPMQMQAEAVPMKFDSASVAMVPQDFAKRLCRSIKCTSLYFKISFTKSNVQWWFCNILQKVVIEWLMHWIGKKMYEKKRLWFFAAQLVHNKLTSFYT